MPNQGAQVLPGVHGPVPETPVLVHPKPEPRTSTSGPKTVSTRVPLSQQGWTRSGTDDDGGTSGATATAGTSATATARSTTRSESAIYENINPFGLLKDPGDRPDTVQVKVEPGQQPSPRSILKKDVTKEVTKKKVQYSASTKGTRPPVPKRPPTPDFEIKIRPTSTLDLVDEILAGQPSKRVDGQTVPDTLIQIHEPTPHEQAKKSKRQVPPTDRVLRDKKPSTTTKK